MKRKFRNLCGSGIQLSRVHDKDLHSIIRSEAGLTTWRDHAGAVLVIAREFGPHDFHRLQLRVDDKGLRSTIDAKQALPHGVTTPAQYAADLFFHPSEARALQALSIAGACLIMATFAVVIARDRALMKQQQRQQPPAPVYS